MWVQTLGPTVFLLGKVSLDLVCGSSTILPPCSTKSSLHAISGSTRSPGSPLTSVTLHSPALSAHLPGRPFLLIRFSSAREGCSLMSHIGLEIWGSSWISQLDKLLCHLQWGRGLCSWCWKAICTPQSRPHRILKVNWGASSSEYQLLCPTPCQLSPWMPCLEAISLVFLCPHSATKFK